jgi:hypothetical protein
MLITPKGNLEKRRAMVDVVLLQPPQNHEGEFRGKVPMTLIVAKGVSEY